MNSCWCIHQKEFGWYDFGYVLQLFEIQSFKWGCGFADIKPYLYSDADLFDAMCFNYVCPRSSAICSFKVAHKLSTRKPVKNILQPRKKKNNKYVLTNATSQYR